MGEKDLTAMTQAAKEIYSRLSVLAVNFSLKNKKPDDNRPAF
jgi:hypothetical protein